MTRATARDGLHAFMDATALNHEQDHALANRTPELDSIAEYLCAVAASPDPQERKRLRDQGLILVARVKRSNAAEGECHRLGAGVQEQLVGHASPVSFDRTRR